MIYIILFFTIFIIVIGFLYIRKTKRKYIDLENKLENEHSHNKETHFFLQETYREIKESMIHQFKNLANEILEEKSNRFTKQNQENINAILQPLSEKLNEFKQQVNDTYQNEARERFALKQEIERLANLNVQISHDAQSLASVFQNESKIQGNWGELVLEKILENSGLRKGEEYLVQHSYTSKDGCRLQPDIVLCLPEKRHLIIDSKVSVKAYINYQKENKNGKISQELLMMHIQSIKQHIQELSAKNYQDLYGLHSIDFVLMFIPVEPAFLLAIQHSSDLYQDALNKNIILVCSSTLLATVRTVAHLWRQEHQNRNSQEIARQCAALYDKFVNFVEDLEKIGQRLEQAQSSYTEAMNKLKFGKGNIIRMTENFKKLGVKPNKSLPSRLLDSEE